MTQKATASLIPHRPTTLRLLSLPSAWEGFIETNTSGTSCLGPLAGLQEQQVLYQACVRALADGGLTTLLLVSRPDRASLNEAARYTEEVMATTGKGLGPEALALLEEIHPDSPGHAARGDFGDSAGRGTPS